MNPKHLNLLILACILTMLNSCSQAHAGWLGWGDGEHARQQRLEEEQQRKLAEAEHQVMVHRKSVETWELVAGSAAVGAVLLFIVGTALGTRTRHAAARPQS